MTTHVLTVGIIPFVHPANERKCYFVTSYFIGRAHAQNDLCDCLSLVIVFAETTLYICIYFNIISHKRINVAVSKSLMFTQLLTSEMVVSLSLFALNCWGAPLINHRCLMACCQVQINEFPITLHEFVSHEPLYRCFLIDGILFLEWHFIICTVESLFKILNVAVSKSLMFTQLLTS